MKLADCELCKSDGGAHRAGQRVAARNAGRRAELSRLCARDLERACTRDDRAAATTQRLALMRTVFAVESAQREVLAPLKINLASLGNMTPHLHWHVIARFADDLHYPQPVWGAPQRTPDDQTLQARRALVDRLREVIAEKVSRVS